MFAAPLRVVANLQPLRVASLLDSPKHFALGRAAKERFSAPFPCAHWIGPEVCGQ